MSALNAEIASLERELEQDVRYVHLRELKRVLRFYGTAMSSQSGAHAEVQEKVSGRKQLRQSVRQPSSAREKALAAAKEYIGGLDRIVPTRELLEQFVANGIEVGGATPLNNLSAMLSTSGMFESHGRRGWTVKNTQTKFESDENGQEKHVNPAHDESEKK